MLFRSENQNPDVYYWSIIYFHSCVTPTALSESDVLYLHLYVAYQKAHKRNGMSEQSKSLTDSSLQEAFKSAATYIGTSIAFIASTFTSPFIGIILSPLSIYLSKKVIDGISSLAPTLTYNEFSEKIEAFIVEEIEIMGEEAFYTKYGKG